MAIAALTLDNLHRREWLAPNGVVWISRKLIDPEQHKHLKKKWKRRHPGEAWPYPEIAWPRLWDISFDVKGDHLAEECCGQIRRISRADAFKLAPVQTKDCAPTWYYHPDDVRKNMEVPAAKEVFKETERQQAKSGPHKGKWFIAPRLVVERLEFDRSSFSRFQVDGIPWSVKVGKKPRIVGKRLVNKRKPVAAQFRYGPGRRQDWFWLETDVDDFAREKQALTAKPKQDGEPGFFLIEETGMRQPKLPKESHLGKDKNGQVAVRRIIAPEDMEAYRKPRNISPVQPGMMSVRDIIDLFAGAKMPLTDTTVRKWFVDGQKCPKGKLRCLCNWKGKPTVFVRWGYHIPAEKVRRKWAEKFPGRPWPLPEYSPKVETPPPNGQSHHYGNSHGTAAGKPMPSAASHELKNNGEPFPGSPVNLREVESKALSQFKQLFRDILSESQPPAHITVPLPVENLLIGWPEILDAIRRKKEHRKLVERLNRLLDGPIKTRQGGSPLASHRLLIEWWNGLIDRWEETDQKEINTRTSVENQHPYGRDGTVVHDIGGSIKPRKS